MAILLITHDLGIVRKHADRVAVMTQGKIIETGNTEELFLHPQHSLLLLVQSGHPTVNIIFLHLSNS